MTTAPAKTEIPDDLLRLLAEDAAAVFYWAFRLKMTRPQMVEETVKAFKKRLTEFVPDPQVQGATAGAPANQAQMTAAQKDGGDLSSVGQGGRTATAFHAKSEHQDAASQCVGNEPEVGGTATAANSQIEPDVKADPAQADARLDLARAH